MALKLDTRKCFCASKFFIRERWILGDHCFILGVRVDEIGLWTRVARLPLRENSNSLIG